MNSRLPLRIIFFVLLLPCSAFGIEKPAFDVLEEWEGGEIRSYPSTIVARTRVEASFNDAGSEGFRRLGGYIFGDNVAEQKISMTAPVSQSPAGDNSYWVTFFMPAAYELADLPRPRNASVIVEVLPSQTLAVLRYKGGWSEKLYREHEDKLRTLINANPRWKITGESLWARYNPPIMPSFFRSNEVMIPVEPTKSEHTGTP